MPFDLKTIGEIWIRSFQIHVNTTSKADTQISAFQDVITEQLCWTGKQHFK